VLRVKTHTGRYERKGFKFSLIGMYIYHGLNLNR